MKKFDYFPVILTTSLALLSIILLVNIFKIIPPDKLSHFSAQLELVIHILILTTLYKIYKKMKFRDKRLIKWLIFANIGVLINDLTFYFSVYLSNNYILSASFLTFTFGYIPYLTWQVAILVFLLNLLTKVVFRSYHFIKALPFFIVINASMTYLFFSSMHDTFGYLTWASISHILSFLFESIIFDLITLCLIYTDSLGITLILSGFIVLISGDFFINYCFLSQTKKTLFYGEILWLIGLLLEMIGLFHIIKNQSFYISSWLNYNTIKSRLALCFFSISITGFFLFFIAVYSFSIINRSAFLCLPLFIMNYTIIVVTISIIMGRYFEIPFKKLAKNIELLSTGYDPNKINNEFSIKEFIFLQTFITDAFKFREERDKAKKEFGMIVLQAAHDIRSPIATLTAAINNNKKTEQEGTMVIRSAARRLNDIVNYLLLTRKKLFSSNNILDDELQSENIFLVIHMLVSEKKYEYSTNQVNLLFIATEESKNVFAKIYTIEFNRILSNLINNAVEATNYSGTINIKLSTYDDQLYIEVSDNGKGIPKSILHKVTEEGFTFGKTNGAGLGLFHAKIQIERFNGEFSIESIEGSGTTVFIKLTRSNPPSWFCDHIIIKKKSKILILSEDQYIHDSWKKKLPKDIVKLYNFYDETCLLEQRDICSDIDFYLVDYQLKNTKRTGLDIIANLAIQNKAILMTNDFYHHEAREKCIQLNIKLLPSSLITSFNIFQNANSFNEAILIDNDKLVRFSWEFSAESAGIKLYTFSSLREFEEAKTNFCLTTPIYIDSLLDNQIKGEDLARDLYKNGFKTIFLSTGCDFERFKYMPWLAGLIEKNPPF